MTYALEEINAGQQEQLSACAGLDRQTVQALSSHIAVLDRDGTIVSVNQAWADFACGNAGSDVASVKVGANYLEVCRRASAANAEDADQALAGIEAVLSGISAQFNMEYACHSPAEQRWFLMTVTPLGGVRGAGAVISHVNITARKQAEEALRQSEVKYRSLFENTPEAVLLTVPEGGVLSANPAACALFGMSEAELIQAGRTRLIDMDERKLDAYLAERARTGRVSGVEVDFIRKNGPRFPAEVDSVILPGEPKRAFVVIRDITERKRAQAEREITLHFLRMVNASKSTHELLKAAVLFIQEHAGCDAVGIRLKQGNDFPYRETLGFSSAFLQAENTLYACENEPANGLTSCLCGQVIAGKLGLSDLALTPHGSFWSNDIEALLKRTHSPPEPLRGMCLEEGYHSLALLPLYDGPFRMGLLQVNAWRKNAFTPNFLSLWENLANHLAVAISKFRADEELRQQAEALRKTNHELKVASTALQASEERIQHALRVSRSFTFEWVPATDQVRRSASCGLILKLTGDDTCTDTGDRFFTRVHPGDRAQFVQTLQALTPASASYTTEYRVVCDDGGIAVLEETGQASFDGDGKLERVVGITTDITERKQTEEVLRFLGQSHAGPSGEKFFQQLALLLAQTLNMDFVCIDRLTEDLLSAQTLAVFNNSHFEDNISYTLKDTPCGDVVGKKICCFPKDVCRLFPRDAVLQELKADSYLGTTLWDTHGKPIGLIAVIGQKPLMNTQQAEAILQLVAVRAAGELERLRVEESLRQLNAELEQRVASRTAELAETNRELEAFCYSVSHDLRAPLRSMDGFSLALLEDAGPQLDANGQDYLNRIRSNCQRMARLIDDLLHLSRLTRAQIRHQPVDLTALAQAIIAELRQAEPERVVDVRISSNMLVTGDPVLLRTALANLLQNAWKFTSQRPDAVIEVGRAVGSQGSTYAKATADRSGFRVQGSARKEVGDQAPQDTPVFFVRDNGVGFDMQYADKLFTPFQRLHAMTDFPGSGIGLATVQRVINRHNGRIWFEAAPGNGATFYFTIGDRA
jgi:PAS domain S-box-containing protein